MTWVPRQTGDGSFTFFSEAFGEAFHSDRGAKSEAFEKFSQITELAKLAQEIGRVRILDVCYGLGYNSAAALETIWQVNPDCDIELYALELDPTVPIAATHPDLCATWSVEVREVLMALAQELHCDRQGLTAKLLIGDARTTIDAVIVSGFQADAILLDPFSPRKCPQLWTVEFLQCVTKCLAPSGKLATYSRSAAVRSALLEVGLVIGSIPLEPKPTSNQWSMGTVAAWAEGLRSPLPELSPMEWDHLTTNAGIPFRDPNLKGTPEEILAQHESEQNASQRRSTSSWRRQWSV
jgi:tRNA U34 5-methylaminomethyl-2-thiouridine-forming methyltransferase MnmC